MGWRCGCGCNVMENGECPSCAVYNAAVRAQHAAAHAIAKEFSPHCRRAWLNEHGVFAWLHGKARQVASPEVAAPFVALTTAARMVTFERDGTLMTAKAAS